MDLYSIADECLVRIIAASYINLVFDELLDQDGGSQEQLSTKRYRCTAAERLPSALIQAL